MRFSGIQKVILFSREPFDLDLFLKAINLFNGEHNFSAFTTKFGRNQMVINNKNPIKTVKIGIILDYLLKIFFIPIFCIIIYI